MQKYKYKAVDLQKKVFKGTFMAEDERDLARQLAKQDLYLVSAQVVTKDSPSSFWTLGTGTVSLKELTTFCRQFAIMINAGITVVGCLDSLKNQAYSTYFKALLNVISEDVKSGVMLSDALAKHKKAFPDFFRSMIYVGEASGRLEIVLNSLADYYEKDASIKSKTKAAFSYPIMLSVMIVGITILMLAFVVPTFREVLLDLEVEITGLTKFVYDLSDFIVTKWRGILITVLAVAGVLFGIGMTEKGKFFYDFLKIRIPIIKQVQIDLITSRFARSFGLLLSSGMGVTDALDAVTIVINNRELCHRFKKAAEDVKHGKSLAVAFEEYKLFPEIMLQMISTGERTASIDDILARACGFFDDQVERTLNSVTSKIQPILLILMGVIVGGLFIAVYSPMLSIMTGLGT